MKTLLLFVAFICWPVNVTAQERGAITGRVVNESGKPLVNVHVRLDFSGGGELQRLTRADAAALLGRHMGALDAALARRACDILMDEGTGLIRDLGFDEAGMATVLRLRSKFGQPGKQLSDASRYIDISYLRQALDS